MGKIILLLSCLFFLFLLATTDPLSSNSVFAQTSGTCSSSSAETARVREGLVSTPDITQNLATNTGICIIDPKAAFAPYKLPAFEDLKSLYFDRSKSTRTSTYTGDANQGNITSLIQSSDTERLIYVTGNLTITGNGFLNGKPVVPIIIFIQGNLTINNDITFANNSSNGGLVFVVKGNVDIAQTVTSLDAVIISEGTIYTAGANCATASVQTANALTINGSLISLNESSPAYFCRTLDNNNQPAEKINHQVKYLVILRNLMSDTFQKWSEI